MAARPKEELFCWTVRRRFMFAVSGFCMLVIGYILIRGLDTGPADTAMTMAFFTLIGIVGSYVFGATWEDVATKKIMGPAAVASRYSPRPQPASKSSPAAASPVVEDMP